MVHIKKVKTLKGVRYAVVAPFTSTTKDINNNTVTTTKDYPVEYKVGDNVVPAIFPVTSEGLEKAKEIQKLFKK